MNKTIKACLQQHLYPIRDFRGFRSLSPASIFVSVDNDALRNPLLGIAAERLQ